MPGVSDFFSGVLGAMNTAYNLYTNQRDFDYQKALQQQIFQREDTAVQRRMADLKAAGINPNLAAGSAASAGSVVSRSNTNDVNMGSALDTIQALNNIRLQKQETQNKQVENDILKENKAKVQFDREMSLYQMASSLGFDVYPDIYLNKNGQLNLRTKIPHMSDMVYNLDDGSTSYTNLQKFRNMVIGQMNREYDYGRLQYDLLQKDYDWYTADKISGLAFNLLGLGIPKFHYKIK